MGKSVGIAVGEGDAAHFQGVRLCGLVWACPVCGPKIRQHRAVEIGQALQEAVRRGGGVALLTCTVRHRKGQALSWLYEQSEAAWRGLQQQRGWREAAASIGLEGMICFREITYGENGWHPHRHVALILREPMGQARLEAFAEKVWKVWAGQLAKRGLSATRAHGIDVAQGTGGGIGRYAAKVEGLGVEMARGDLKVGQGGSWTPEQLVERLRSDGDAEAAELWLEYARATEGRRMTTWSKGLRKRLALAEELSDEEVVEEEVGGHVVALVTATAYWRIMARGMGAEVLDAVEVGTAELESALVAAGCPDGSWCVDARLFKDWAA